MSNVRETYQRLLKLEQGVRGETIIAKKAAWIDTCMIYSKSGAMTLDEKIELSEIGKEIADVEEKS